MPFITAWLILISLHWDQCYFKAPLGPSTAAGPQVTSIYFPVIRILMGPSIHVCMMELSSYADLLWVMSKIMKQKCDKMVLIHET